VPALDEELQMKQVTVYEISEEHRALAMDYMEFMQMPAMQSVHWRMTEGNVPPHVVHCERVQRPVYAFGERGVTHYLCIGPKLAQLVREAVVSEEVRELKRQREAERLHAAREIGLLADQVTSAQQRNIRMQQARFTEIASFRALPWYKRVWRALENK
jgi:hypothetical protein